MDLERTVLRKVGEAISRFKMIRGWRPGWRWASRAAKILDDAAGSAAALAEASPHRFFGSMRLRWSKGKFLSPIQPIGRIPARTEYRLDLRGRPPLHRSY